VNAAFVTGSRCEFLRENSVSKAIVAALNQSAESVS